MLCAVAALTSVLLAVAPAFDSGSPASGAIGQRVRGATPAVHALLALGIRRSPTFARLVEALNATDVLVHVETTRDLPKGLDGRLSFMATAGGVRYLRVQALSTVDFDGLIAIVGHELQHALEVAAHPEVRVSADLRQLYERIGIPGVKGRYDTAAARLIGRLVREELG